MNRQLTNKSVAAAIALALGSVSAYAISYYDLTISANVSAQVNGAYFFNRGSTNVIETATGTGLFNTYLAVSDQGDAGTAAEGYNVGPNSVMPEVNAAKTEYIRPGPGSFGTDVLLAEPDATLGEGGGQAFFAFGLDINEPTSGATPYLSVDKIEIYVSPNALANGTTKANLLALGSLTKVYDMDIGTGNGGGPDSSVLLDYRISSSGSGRADMALLVPKANFTNVAGFNTNWYVYFYTVVGDTGTLIDPNRDYGENAGGFEEWGTLKGFTFYVPPLVPEASTFAAVVGVGVAFAGYGWARRRQRRS